jgi:hypothetical protein
MKAIFKLIQSIVIIALAVYFVKWYIKGHKGKYAVLFWLNTIIACLMFFNAKTNQPKEDTTHGSVYWERNVKKPLTEE